VDRRLGDAGRLHDRLLAPRPRPAHVHRSTPVVDDRSRADPDVERSAGGTCPRVPRPQRARAPLLRRQASRSALRREPAPQGQRHHRGGGRGAYALIRLLPASSSPAPGCTPALRAVKAATTSVAGPSIATDPLSIQTARSQRLVTVPSEWDTSTNVTPCSRKRFMRSTHFC